MNITGSIPSHSLPASHAPAAAKANQDSILSSLQDQVKQVQEQLQSLSNNKHLSQEQIMNKRKELQSKLQELNRQINQRKMEIQKEKREEAAAAREQKEPQRQERREVEQTELRSLDTVTMHGLIRAEASMKNVNSVQAVRTGMERETRILETEIKLDLSRGGSATRKSERLASLQEGIHKASKEMGAQSKEARKALEETGRKQEKNTLAEVQQEESVTDREETAQASTAMPQSPEEAADAERIARLSSRNWSKGQFIDRNL